MPRGIPHPDETRAAVLAALLQGQSIHAVADAYKVDRKTVREWAAALDMSARMNPPAVPPEKGQAIPELVAGYLRESLTTLQVQAEFFRDKAWLTKQPASELAVLHGVVADKAIRILSAIEAAQQQSEEGA